MENTAQLILRAHKPLTGKVSWERTICDEAPKLIPKCGVEITACDGARTFIVGSKNGRSLSDDMGICADDTGARVLFSETCSNESWQVGEKGTIVVKSTGLLSFRARHPSNHGWERHEGLAHPVDAAFYELRPDGARVLVVVSQLGGVYGLDVSRRGKVLWWVDAAERIRSAGDSSEAPTPSFRMKLVKGHRAGVIVLASHDSRLDVLTLNAANGNIIDRELLDSFSASHAAIRSHEALCVDLLSFDHMEAFVGPGCPRGYPTGPEDPPSRWLVAHGGSNVIQGLSDGKVVWEAGLPRKGRVLSVTLKDDVEPLGKPPQNAPVRVTGERKIMYKYVHSSVALVLSLDEGTEERTEGAAGGISASLFDVDTGAVIDAMRHPSASAELVAAVAADNWFVYSFWNPELLENELHVIDMYGESPRKPWLREALLAQARDTLVNLLPDAVRNSDVVQKSFAVLSATLKGAQPSEDTNYQCSSENGQCSANEKERAKPTGLGLKGGNPQAKPKPLALPTIVRSSYLTTHLVYSLGVTVSERSATDRAVIMGLASGRVAQISRLFLDARRPDVSSRKARDENLIPYSPRIGLWPSVSGRLYHNDGMEVAGIVQGGSIITSPVQGEESSCHISILGTDISYGTIAPAGKFDRLPQHFDYGPVLGTIGILVLVGFLLEEKSRNKILEKHWL